MRGFQSFSFSPLENISQVDSSCISDENDFACDSDSSDEVDSEESDYNKGDNGIVNGSENVTADIAISSGQIKDVNNA